MDRYYIALKKIPKKASKITTRDPVVKKRKADEYSSTIFYRSTLNTLLYSNRRYEAGEVVMVGSEPVGICIDSNNPSYEINDRVTYCHGAGTVISTNRMDSANYALGDKLYSVGGLLTKRIPTDSTTVVAVVIDIKNDGIMIQMRI
jgi:hypothetical protein